MEVPEGVLDRRGGLGVVLGLWLRWLGVKLAILRRLGVLLSVVRLLRLLVARIHRLLRHWASEQAQGLTTRVALGHFASSSPPHLALCAFQWLALLRPSSRTKSAAGVAREAAASVVDERILGQLLFSLPRFAVWSALLTPWLPSSLSRSRSRSPNRRRSLSRSRSRSASPPRPFTIKVQHLTKNVTTKHLEEIFTHYGPITQVELPIIPRRESAPLFAFVPRH